MIMFFNILKTITLLSILSGLFIALGGFIGGTTGIQCALFFSFLMNGISFFFSDKIVLNMYGAQPLNRKHYEWIYLIVEELAYSMTIPMPKLWLVQNNTANAFATGRSPRHASIAITSGIISILDQDELRGVLAHELAHIKNRDTLITTIAATLSTAIGYSAYYLRHMAFWGSFSDSNRRKQNNPFALMIVGMLMPLAATLLQLALSRSREYMADETGAHYCHDPLALASALEKLQRQTQHTYAEKEHAMAALWIVHPFTTKGSWMTLFSTHPPTQERVVRLRRIFEKMFS